MRASRQHVTATPATTGALGNAEILQLLSAYEKVGIASRNRLEDAPTEYAPERILPEFRSVIVLARVPQDPPEGNVPGKFHKTIGVIAAQDAAARYLKSLGYEYRIIGSRATYVSLPRLGERAGVGQMSPFHTLAVKGYGLRTVLSAMITDAPLEPTPLVSDACRNPKACLKKCSALGDDGAFDRGSCVSCGACVKHCPVS